MMSSASLQGNISPAIYQRPLLCVHSVMSHLPLQPGREAHEDSGVRPERRLSRDAEAPGEKWHSICFPSCYLDSHVWLTYPCQVTHDVFFSHFDWACLGSHGTRSPWLAERLVNSWTSFFLLHSHLAGSAVVSVSQHNLENFSKTVGKAYTLDGFALFAIHPAGGNLSDTITFLDTFILSSATAEKCSVTQKLARWRLYTDWRSDKEKKKFKIMHVVHQNGRTLHVMWLHTRIVEQFCFWYEMKGGC